MASTASDFDLASAAALGDEAAFGELYERYFDRLYDFAIRTVGDGDVAADVVQSTFVKAWDQLRKGTPPEHVKAWLFTVARNAAIDEVRRTKRSSSLDPVAGGDSEEPGSGLPAFAELDPARAINPEVANVDREMVDLVWAAARGLNDKEYTLLDMHVRQELSVEEIAAALEAKPGNVYTMLSRLRDSFEAAVVAELMLRRGRKDCPELDAVLNRMQVTVLNRKVRGAIQDHIQACAVCQRSRRSLVAPSAIFAGLVPVLPAGGLSGSIWAHVQAHPPATGAGTGGGGSGSSIRQPPSLSGARLALLGGAVALAAAVAIILFLVVGASDSSGQLGPVKTGYLFIDGHYVAPPYTFDVTSTSVSLNGTQLLSVRKPAKPASSDGEPKDAYQVVDRAAARMVKLGLTSSNVSDPARMELANLMRGFAVTASVEDQGDQMIVRDKTGAQAILILETDVGPRGDESASFLVQAKEWREILASGGVLLLSPGVSIDLPDSKALALMSLLHQNAGIAGGADKLTRVLGDRTVAEDLAAAGDLPPGLRQRLPAQLPAPLVESTRRPAPAAGLRAGGSGLFMAGGPLRDENDHELSKTPGTDKAYFFLNFDLTPAQQKKADAKGEGGVASGPLLKAARLHHYERLIYRKLTTKGSRIGPTTLLSFAQALKSGNVGILYVDTHGYASGGGALQIESFANTDDLVKQINKERADNPELKDLNVAAGEAVEYAGETSYGLLLFVDGDKSKPNFGTGMKQLWKDHDSVVEIDTCHGMAVQPAFATAREFIAPSKCALTRSSLAVPFNTEFWGSMDGTLHDGHNRNVDKAYANAKRLGGGIYEWVSRVDGATVLSPAIVTKLPPGPLTVGVETEGKAVFDVEMDTNKLPVLTFGYECNAQLVAGSEKWMDNRTLVFKFIPKEVALLKITIGAANAQSTNTIELDGNTVWEGSESAPGTHKDHVGPNQDDYEWIVACYAAEKPAEAQPQPSPSPSPSPPPPPSASPSPSPSPGPRPSPSPSPSPAIPSDSPSPSPSPSDSASPLPSPAPSPSPSPSPAPPLVSGDYGGTVAVLMDPAGHSCCVHPATTWRVRQTKNTVTLAITMNLSLVLPSITLSTGIPATGAPFTATSIGTVAGYPNVSVSFTGTVTPEGGVNGVLTVGGNGALPTGRPITFTVHLSKQ